MLDNIYFHGIFDKKDKKKLFINESTAKKIIVPGTQFVINESTKDKITSLLIEEPRKLFSKKNITIK